MGADDLFAIGHQMEAGVGGKAVHRILGVVLTVDGDPRHQTTILDQMPAGENHQVHVNIAQIILHLKRKEFSLE